MNGPTEACQAGTCFLVRYRPCGARSASETEDRSFHILAAASSRYVLSLVDHLVVVVASGEYTSKAAYRPL
jgi:hypothetical protein